MSKLGLLSSRVHAVQLDTGGLDNISKWPNNNQKEKKTKRNSATEAQKSNVCTILVVM